MARQGITSWAPGRYRRRTAIPQAPHEQPQASPGAPEPSPRPESSGIAARLPREGRQGDSPGDCGTGTRCPRQGHTVHTGSQAPPLPVTARLAAQRGPGRAQRGRRVGNKDGPGPRPAPLPPGAPAASPVAFAAMLTSARRAGCWVARGAGPPVPPRRRMRPGGRAVQLTAGNIKKLKLAL